MGFELTTLEVIVTDCIGSSKSNYHTITTTTALKYTMKTNIKNIEHVTSIFHKVSDKQSVVA